MRYDIVGIQGKATKLHIYIFEKNRLNIQASM